MPTFTNQAALTYNGTTVNSNIVTGELLEVITAAKTAVTDTYSVGDDVTYVISIVNTGTTAFTDLTVTDDLGAYTFGSATLAPLTYVPGSVRLFVNGVLQPAPTVTAGASLVFSGIDVPAGGSAVIVYEATVNSFAPLTPDSTITNTATVTGGGIATAVTASETITADGTSNLTITKSLSPATVTDNGTLTYTFVIQNTGSEAVTIGSDAFITDTFDPILNPISVTFNGTPWTSPANYSYNTATGVFATVPGQVTVPAATFVQDPVTGVWSIEPGVSILTITGTV